MNPAELLNNKGTQLLDSGLVKPAVAFFRRAVSIDSENLAMRTNLAVGLSKIPGLQDEASTLLQDVLKADPANSTALHALGVLNDHSGFHEAALDCFKECQRLAGPQSNALGFDFDVATSLIQTGQWLEGWKQYECRRRWKPEKTFETLKTWNGEQGKRIYCWAEQGFGDTLQFSRYVPWLVAQSERILFAVPSCMLELFLPFQSICDVAPIEAGTPADAEFEIPLMSLPFLHGKEIPNDPDLLRTAPVDKRRFAADTDLLNVGIAWAAGSSSIRVEERTVPIEDFAQLAGDSTRKLYSIQGDDRVRHIYEKGVQQLIQDMTPHIQGDWCATRDLIMQMDVVVTTDTSVAHLAAILKKPTIMLLCRMDNWRWEYSWYPSMTILRQSVRGSWDAELRQADVLLDQIASSIADHRAS